MIIDFQMEAAKRRETSQKHPGLPRDSASGGLYETRPNSADRSWPTVDCGSGWYHADAMGPARPIQSHRDWD